MRPLSSRIPSIRLSVCLLVLGLVAHGMAQLACGDCDARGDGTTLLDGLAAARITVGLDSPTSAQATACDVDSSGITDVRDVFLLASHSAGLPATLQCGAAPPPAANPQPVVMAYVESLRYGYANQIPLLDYSLVDVVIHGFVTPQANGTITENGNFTDFRTWPWAAPPNQPLPDEVHAAGKKIVMSIGGATVPGSTFAAIARDPGTRATFVQNVVNHIAAIGYDGVDIDWEWPASTAEGADFTLLMSELYAGVKAQNPDHLVIFGAGPGNFIGFREWSALGSVCDYCFFFGYDWRNPALGPMTNPGSTFYSASGASFEASVRGALEYALGEGFPADQIVMGMPFYSSTGQSWSQATSAQWAAGSPWTLHPDYLEVQMGGAWWSPPEAISAKMDAVLDPTLTVLTGPTGPTTIAGVGWWEWGHEDPNAQDLSNAVRAWLAAHP